MSTNQALLLGLDFGSTTSSALLAQARIASHCVTGRMALQEPQVLYRAEPVFTPFCGQNIDVQAIQQLIHHWLAEAGVTAAQLFSGGAIITGLAARQENAQALRQLISEQIGNALITCADDGGLESWLAFMGSCSALSRCHPEEYLLNLDIGGGTTNAALGLAGNVLTQGCQFIGARHLQFEPGSYQLRTVSSFGEIVLADLQIHRQAGDKLQAGELQRLLEYYVTALEALVAGTPGDPRLTQLDLHWPVDCSEVAVTFSGGVGELLYRHLAGEPLPGTTYYGDLGIDLALAISRSPRLMRDASRLLPENRGRATVYGLTLHNTEISGSTLYLPNPECLPLKDLPIIARLPATASQQSLEDAVQLALRTARGACLQLLCGGELDLATLRQLAERLAGALQQQPPSNDWTLVLLLDSNCGKALGNYISNWGRRPFRLLVIDEVRERQAHFVNLGQPHQHIVPVTFYGVH